MQILFASPMVTLVLDIVSWVVFHLAIGYPSSKIPYAWLNPNRCFFQTRLWEKDGRIYDEVFLVRAWKYLIPDGSRFYRGAFSIRNLPTNDMAYLVRWLNESVRSEICHWAMIIPGFFFFLWNDIMVGWIMLVYAFLNNLVPIIMQRFNRPRMRRLIVQLERNLPVKELNPVAYNTSPVLGRLYR